jgi:hypothetical protein
LDVGDGEPSGGDVLARIVTEFVCLEFSEATSSGESAACAVLAESKDAMRTRDAMCVFTMGNLGESGGRWNCGEEGQSFQEIGADGVRHSRSLQMLKRRLASTMPEPSKGTTTSYRARSAPSSFASDFTSFLPA